MIRNLAQPLPATPAGTPNFSDIVAPSWPSVWTPGAGIIAPLQGDPNGQAARWTLYGFSISCSLSRERNPFSSGSLFGVFGRLIAGIARTRVPYAGQQPMPPLPADTSLLLTLFDGESDPTPMASLPGTNLRQSLQLPQPIGEEDWLQYSVGAWLTPSLLGNLPLANMGIADGLLVSNLTITITYDDGLDSSAYPA